MVFVFGSYLAKKGRSGLGKICDVGFIVFLFLIKFLLLQEHNKVY
jgi:hypothetical protein